LGMAVFTADQFRSVAQDGKIIGISLEPQENGQLKTEVAALSAEELPVWREDNNALPSGETIAEALNIDEKYNTEATDLNEQPQETEDAGTEQPQGTEASNSEPPQETAAGSVSAQEIAGTYSGSATLQHIEEDVEGPDSLPVTIQLNESGTGTAEVNGYSGEAQCAGSNVSFSVTMKDDTAAIYCLFEGTLSKSGSQIVISGSMSLWMMGVAFATYSLSAQK